MPRRREVAKREIIPDPKFNSELVSQFVNRVMLDGKKAKAENIVYKALESVMTKLKKGSIKIESTEDEGGEGGQEGSLQSRIMNMSAPEILDYALEKVRPVVEVRSRRVGGATYQVPVEVRPERRNTLAMRWVIESAKNRGDKGMVARLAGEILDVLAGKGAAIKKREDVHKMAKANQAFAHFRWAA